MSELFQSVPFAVVLLIIGFVFLVKGADIFVEGCCSIARRYKVPSLIIGMTIVAMGTSLPETAVSVTAAITGNNALAVSNAVGSNIFNLMVVVGACTLFTPVFSLSAPLTEITDALASFGCALTASDVT